MGSAGQMGRARERGGTAGRALLPGGLLRPHAAPRRRRVQAGRHGDPAERDYQEARTGSPRPSRPSAATTSRAAAPCGSPTGRPRSTSRRTCSRSSRSTPRHAADGRASAGALAPLPGGRRRSLRCDRSQRRGGGPARRPRGDRPDLRRARVPDPPAGRAARTRALEHSASLREHQAHATRAMAVVFAVGARAARRASPTSSCACAAPRSRGSPRSPSPTRSPGCATTARSRRTSRASCSASAAPAIRCRSSCSTSTA